MRIGSQEEVFYKFRERRIPKEATMELTYRCNLRCVHCFLEEEETTGELSSDEIFAIIDQLADAGTMQVCFTGGEALLRNDFFDAVAHARKRHMAVGLISNGTLIDDEVARLIKRYHFSTVMVSLLGATAETHDSITRVAGSFFRTSRAIRSLRDLDVSVQVKTPIMSKNWHEIEGIAGFCDDVGAGMQIGPVLSPTTKGSRRPLQFRMDDAQLAHYLRWEISTGRSQKGFYGMCNAGFSNVGISARGKVFPCIVLRVEAGDLRKQRFSDIWNSSAVLGETRRIRPDDFRECSRCELLDTCSRCPGQSLEEEGDMLLAPHESCRIARMRHELASRHAEQQVSDGDNYATERA